jgi:hypothetical protein
MQAASVAETASKSIAELQITAEDDSEKSEKDVGDEGSAKESDDESDTAPLKKSALDRLEKASEDSLLSQVSIDGYLFYFWGDWGNLRFRCLIFIAFQNLINLASLCIICRFMILVFTMK